MPPILTARVGRNAGLFADVLKLYVPEGSRVLDMTFGKGLFWTETDASRYALVSMDKYLPAMVQADLRALPFRAEAFDAAVLDPPYGQHGKKMPIKASIAKVYNLAQGDAPTSWREVLTLYILGVVEATRMLRIGGVLIIKCQDQQESGRQHWIHARLLELAGYDSEDLFVLVQPTTPAMRHDYQRHARKNHSYFIVLRKR